ncbi:MAG: phosphoribosyltransferase [Acidobacteriota bacterium]|nr:phosphoribosyltransferase [Acidobacteriota bacterium]
MPAQPGLPDGVAVARFADRRAAGRLLAAQLASFAGRDDVVVLALPRGGVPVAYEVVLALRAPLDLLLVRKLGVPGHEELAFGAIASGGVRVLNTDVLAEARLTSAQIEQITIAQQRELERREALYRGERPPLQLRGTTALIVDDGLATGATMRAAVAAVRRLDASPVVVAPVAAPSTRAALARSADAIYCAITAEPFVAVGLWYEDFEPTSDEEVRELLDAAQHR